MLFSYIVNRHGYNGGLTVESIAFGEFDMPNNHKRIFLIGHSGAGKGVLAEALAKKLNWKYVNADYALASSIGKRSEEILTEQGDVAFQHCLSQILEHQTHQDNIIVATDDSIVCSSKNRKMLSNEFTVYVKVNIDVQMERITNFRPLLPCKDYKAFIQKLRDERDALYEQCAAFSLSSDNGDIDGHTQQIIEAFKNK